MLDEKQLEWCETSTLDTENRPDSARELLGLFEAPLEQPRTEARAEAWWRLHLPELTPG